MLKFLAVSCLAAVSRAASKVEIQVLQAGIGDTPSKGAQLTTHYVGTLADGTVFDSSVARGFTLDFTLGTGHAIKCWDEAFKTLQRGAKAVITCPPETAFGSRSTSKIPANSTLKFEVELIDFVEPPKLLKHPVIHVREPGEGPAIKKKSTIMLQYEMY